MRRIAVYPGTFDPVTNGHLDLAGRARRHFDHLRLAVLRNEEKQPLFSEATRVGFLKEAVSDWEGVDVEAFQGLLVDYARKIGASVILRGIRAISDFETEMQMAMMNRKLEPEIETVFLMPSEAHSYVSSRLVREIARLGGPIDSLVPAPVVRAFAERFKRT